MSSIAPTQTYRKGLAAYLDEMEAAERDGEVVDWDGVYAVIYEADAREREMLAAQDSRDAADYPMCQVY